MTDERYRQLEADPALSLTENELKEGWHFCFEFDGLLVKGDPNEEYCGEACIRWAGGLD